MIGLGLDGVEIERFRGFLERRPGALERLFSKAERQALSRRADPVPGYAARFAAKEATMKALRVGLGAARFCEIEIDNEDSGAPLLRLSGRAAKLAAERGVSALQVSLSHSEHFAQAVVIAT